MCIKIGVEQLEDVWTTRRIMLPFVTSQFSIWMLYIDHHMHIIFFLHFVILEILSNSRTQGESWRFHKFSYLNFSQIWKEDQFNFNIFSPIISNNKNKWEKIIWLLQQKRNIGERILKSNYDFIGILFAIYWISKILHLWKLHLSPEKCSSCPKY